MSDNLERLKQLHSLYISHALLPDLKQEYETLGLIFGQIDLSR